MTSSSLPNESDRRSAPLDVGESSDVECYVCRHRDNGVLRVHLFGLSANGARIGLSSYMPFDEEFELKIVIPGTEDLMELNGLVRWVRGANDRWMIGCSFESDIDDEELCRLAETGVLERRRETRYPCSIIAVAKFELDCQPQTVEIKDYSIGGFCFVSSKYCEPNRVVRILIETLDATTLSFFGKVRWAAPADGRFLLGCQFASKNAFGQIDEIVAAGAGVVV